MSGSVSGNGKAGVARPSPLACSECRKRHLKCDATLPICSRCSSNSLTCLYMPSRRGYRGPTKRKHDAQHDETRRPIESFERQASDTSCQTAGWTLFTPARDVTPGLNDVNDNIYGFIGSTSGLDLANSLAMFSEPSSGQLPQRPSSAAIEDSEASDDKEDDSQLINLYYANFHAAHPILVPRAWYTEQNYPSYLRLVVQFVGSHFSTSVSSDSLRAKTSSKLNSITAKSPCKVQALLLFAIALHSRNETKEAERVLDRAVTLALELGMNELGFAMLNGRHQAIVEESMRRTWWELFIVDGYMASMHRKPSFKTSQANMSLCLPCEEAIYAEGISLSSPPTLAQFDGRLFADEELQFSSFCYRIEAVRILSRVLAVAGTDEVHEDQIQAVDNALAGWVHHLPASKADIVNNFGEVDEMLFQAHMIIQCSNIFLHFPRSDLLSSLPGTAEIVCSRGSKQMYPTSTQHMHAVKATDASKELSNLAALRVSVQKHTPFFICGLVISAIVQLSACSVHACHCMEQHRDRVTLIIGILKSLGQHWSFAGTVLQQVKKVGAEVLQARTKPDKDSVADSSRDSGVDVSAGIDDLSWYDLFDSEGLLGPTAFDGSTPYHQPP